MTPHSMEDINPEQAAGVQCLLGAGLTRENHHWRNVLIIIFPYDVFRLHTFNPWFLCGEQVALAYLRLV